ncbi:hypothetical protein [Mucilaginibacter rubeus]|uniref:FimB/Mfa2 family fimbrial subunit n=1 Tax=Mucilaginibacter rubeus TaxID=2027860 RepID=A0A5C1I1A1_9SPHI|nr:hypothetical protein [Mucilaginibacter rubeus]QEM11982.1 hypothetical protein DEO27_018740 [Mucilaginibacter rubeus]
MKRYLLGLALICMVVLSCKKQSSDTNTPSKPTKEQHVVTFNVGFSQQTGDLETNSLKTNSTTATTALADVADVMYLAIYNTNGSLLHILKKVSTDNGFGSFIDTLNYGNYTAIFAAGKTGLSLTPEYHWVGKETGGFFVEHNLSTDVLIYGSETGPVIGPTLFNKDAFYKKVALTIPQTAALTINLDRITSQEQVVVEDAIPAKAKALELKISYVASMFYVNSGAPQTTFRNTIYTYSFLTPTDIGKTNYSFNTGIFLAIPLSTQTIVCSSDVTINNSGVDNGLNPDIASITAPNITCLPNKKTVLTGNLFGGAGKPVGNGFHLVTDTSWNSTIVSKPF